MATPMLSKITAVLRAARSVDHAPVVEALAEAGITEIELTFTTPGALEVLPELRRTFGESVKIGMGTVTSVERARSALSAGAQFLVTPGVLAETADIARTHGVPLMMGALTPTEILTAWQAGATFVKVFPANLGGPRYLRDVLGPLPQLKLIPTGGVDVDNAGEFIRAGAVAIALGSNLVDGRSVATDDWETITARAQAIVDAVAQARRG